MNCEPKKPTAGFWFTVALFVVLVGTELHSAEGMR